jgi:hypothetical protein
VTDTVENSLVLNAAVDAAIGACGGDARAAVRALIVMNNYLEAEVKRLAKGVSSGFTRRCQAKRNERPASTRFQDAEAKWRQDIDSRFPHYVNLVPPEDGFSDEVEDKIVQFLTPLYCTLYLDLQSDEPSIHYCFAHEQGAAAFHVAFAGVAVKSRYKKAG